jgi:hypothetical protein
MGIESAAQLPRLVMNTGARRAAAVELERGERLEIIDVKGRQTAVCVAFNRADLNETLSAAMTRARLNSIMLQLNDRLYSTFSRPMLTVEADTVGRHDLLLPAFDMGYFDDAYGAPGHDNCRASLALALQDLGIAYERLPEPITFFGNVSIRQRGELEIRAPLSEAGDYITLEARMDLIVAVAASSQDRTAQNDYRPSELLLRVLGRER